MRAAPCCGPRVLVDSMVAARGVLSTCVRLRVCTSSAGAACPTPPETGRPTWQPSTWRAHRHHRARNAPAEDSSAPVTTGTPGCIGSASSAASRKPSERTRSPYVPPFMGARPGKATPGHPTSGGLVHQRTRTFVSTANRLFRSPVTLFADQLTILHIPGGRSGRTSHSTRPLHFGLQKDAPAFIYDAQPNKRLKLTAPGLGRNCVWAPAGSGGNLNHRGAGGGRRRSLTVVR